MKKQIILLCLLIGLMLLLPSISAWTSSEFTRDEIKSLDKLTNFGTYEIKESAWYDPLKIWTEETIKSIKLKTNTEQCVDCLSEGTIVLNKDGTLIDDLIWKRSFDDGKTFIDWNGYTNWKLLVEEDVDVFETTCVDGKEIIDEKNGTSYFEQDCVTSKTGTTKQWNNLDFKKEYKAGTYNYKIEGSKKASVTYDWIIKTNGQLLESWAVWGAVIGVGGVEANITINSPANNSVSLTNLVTTNASANVTGGAYLTNASLNLSVNGGAWEIRNTTGLIGRGGLVSYYKLDETSGTTAFDSVGSNDGTNNGATINQVGKINKSYFFNGQASSGNYITTNSNFIFNNKQMTLSAWIYPQAESGGIISKRTDDTNDLSLTLNGKKLIFILGNGVGISSPPDVNLNQWSFVTATYNGTHMKIFINGTEVISGTGFSGDLPLDRFYIGWDRGISSPYYWWFNGRIDEASIWNRSLTQAEITALYNSGAGLRPTNTTTTTIIFTNTFNAGDVVDFNYEFCDTDGDCGQSETRRFTIDDLAPTIDLSYPTALIDYGKLNGALELNFTATDTNLDKVWYNYNGTNVTIAGAVSGVYNTSNITLSSKKNVTFCANDTAGNELCQVIGWDYLYFETNTSFNPTALSTSTQSFVLIGDKHSSVTGLTARLFYDGVARASTVSTSGNNVNLTNSFEIPAGSASRNFFWEITAVTSNGTFIFNTTAQTQVVQNISFTVCSVPTGLAYNFTTYDTETNLPVNSTFEATFSYYAAGGSGQVLAEYNYQNLSENRSDYLFCLNSSGLNVTIDAFISYGATGYDQRDYIIDDGAIGNFTVTIPLFLTQTLLTDVVTFTLEDQNYDRISGALVTVQKWNVGTNTYSTIGMFTTSSSGTGIMDLELYNTWYRAIVTIDGTIVHVTDIQKLGSTDWPITIDLEVQNPYDLFGTISQGLEYDNTTQIVTYSWSDGSGYVNTACMTVRRPSGSGYTTLYNDCVETVAGSINYQFLLNGTYEVYGTVYLTAEYENISQVGDFMTITIGTPEITQISSPYGKVISFIIIGTAGLVGVTLGSPILGIILLIAGIWGASMMGWLKGIEAIIWGVITVAIVILARQSRRGS